jgi:hypothetical protein
LPLAVIPGMSQPAPHLMRGRLEYLEKTGFLLEFIPMKIGAGMTLYVQRGLFQQTVRYPHTNLRFMFNYIRVNATNSSVEGGRASIYQARFQIAF